MKKLILILFYLSLPLSLAHGQSLEVFYEDMSSFEVTKRFEELKLDRLDRLQNQIFSLEDEVKTLKKSLNSTKHPRKKESIIKEIDLKEEELEKMKYSFIQASTNIDLNPVVEATHHETQNLTKDVKDILSPFILALKRLSERPRTIQKLKDEVSEFSRELKLTERAIEKLETAYNKTKNIKEIPFNKILIDSIELAKTRKEAMSVQLKDAQYNLLLIEKEEGPALQDISGKILNFLQTKGKNFLFGVIAFLLVFFILKNLKRPFVHLITNWYVKKKKSESRGWIIRPVKVIYDFVAYLLSTFALIITFYILNDWILVTFVLIFVVAIAWSSKNYFADIMDRVYVVLNLGTIKEGERVFYNNLPWVLKTLGFYCRLENPYLSGGSLRVNVRNLLEHTSRPINEKEPWFPSRKDDWVLLSDGLYGKVTMQTPEQVYIQLISGESRFYRTQDFLDKNPQNFSYGFAVEFIFGFDYAQQAILLSEILPTLKKEVRKKIETDFPNDLNSMKSMTLEFKEAASSSLNLRFFLRCEGNLASQRMALERKILTYFVETCNEYQYNIPFNQLTVHLANPHERA